MVRRIAISVSMILAVASYAAPTFALTADDMTEVTGATAEDTLSESFASGDFNGDGYEDMVTGSRKVHTDGGETGAVYVLYGNEDGIAAGSITDVADATYTGEFEYDSAGYSLTSGDLNNDGYDDIAIGALFYTAGNGNTGAVYIIYGQADHLEGGDLGTTIRQTGFSGVSEFGYQVRFVGDMNNDGYDDLMASALLEDSNGVNSGSVYVVYGKEDTFTSGVISDIASEIVGDAAYDHLGTLIAPAGDINGDGYDDALIGDADVDTPQSQNGAIYVVYGQADVYANPSTASDFVKLYGENVNDQVGYAGSGVGDINSDGYDDFVIGDAFYGDDDAGAIYVFYGSPDELTSGSIAQGVRLLGYAAGDETGYEIEPAGDLNDYHTGGTEFYVGAPGVDVSGVDAGAVEVMYSNETEYTNGYLYEQNRAEIGGSYESGNFGMVLGHSDLNGDGYAELLASVGDNDDAASNAGAFYVGYMTLDLDQDGALSPDGIIAGSTDCDDSDPEAWELVTYYTDTDGDGLGDPESSSEFCSESTPESYSSNDDDTNDAVANNGVEIDDDGIDNDNDGTIDEVNTILDNGRHPGYRYVDPTDADAVNDSVVTVRSTKKGKLRVRYADDSVYVYTVFAHPHGKLHIKHYRESGFYIAASHDGSKVVVMNVLNGKKKTKVHTISDDSYTKTTIKIVKIQSNSRYSIVLTSTNGDAVRLYVALFNVSKGKLKYHAVETLELAGVVAKQTTIIGNTIDLRSAIAPLASFHMNSAHELERVD